MFLPDAGFYCFQNMFWDYHRQCRNSIFFKIYSKIARPGKGGRAEVCNSRECGFVFRNDRHRNLLALNSHKIKRNRIYCFGICLNYLISKIIHSAKCISFFVHLTFREYSILWFEISDLISAVTLSYLDWIGFKKELFPFPLIRYLRSSFANELSYTQSL